MKTSIQLRQKYNESLPTSLVGINELVRDAEVALKEGTLQKEDLKSFIGVQNEAFLQSTIQGHSLRSPYGYKGDFEIIDKIYTGHTSSHPSYKAWDEYFHTQAAPIAVRNRKLFFKKWITTKFKDKKEIRLMNVASGPARDLAEAYADLAPSKRLHTTCIELDERAIDYAQKLTEPYKKEINYVQKNILRYRTSEKYDLIWSAGLFDYFNDKVFVFALKKFKNWIKDGGEIVIGNFNEDHNPSRDYMEIFGDWYINHRTANQLIELGLAAGFKIEQLSVEREEENVNLFLHIKA